MKPLYLLFFAAIAWVGCDKSIEGPVTPAIPDAVVQAISGKFPQLAEFAVTNLQTDGLYAADFHEQNNHYKAIISENGTLLSLEKELPQAAIPMNGQQYVTHQYPNSSMAYLFAQLDPSSNAVIGYFTKMIGSGKNYLITLDTLGARISVEEESDTVGWRYPVHRLEDIPQGIRTAINAAQPLSQFLAATQWIDVSQQVRWKVTVVHDSILLHLEFDVTGMLVQNKLEDLLGLDVPGVNFNDLYVKDAVPEECRNYLDAHFQGWEFQRGILRYETVNGNNLPIDFVIKINLGPLVFYTHFDINGNFTGATRG